MPTREEAERMKEEERKRKQESNLLGEYLKQEEEQRRMDDMISDYDVYGQGEPEPSSQSDAFAGSSGMTANVNTSIGANRFHIVVGSFRIPENAVRMVRRLSERGYQPTEIVFRNGYRVISAGSYQQRSDAVMALRRMQSMDAALCPYDAYVYDTAQRLHLEGGGPRW